MHHSGGGDAPSSAVKLHFWGGICKKEAYAELRKARDEARELLTVKANVDRVLQDTGRGIAQEKEHSQR